MIDETFKKLYVRLLETDNIMFPKCKIKHMKVGKNSTGIVFYMEEKQFKNGIFKRSDGTKFEKKEKIIKCYVLSTNGIKEVITKSINVEFIMDAINDI